MRIIRYGDVHLERAGGFSGVIRCTSDALRGLGHEVEVVGREALPLSWCPAPVRRLVVPFAVLRDVVRRNRRGRFDVVEIHEPSGAAYAAARWVVPSLPPLVASSHGLEERIWAAQRARWRGLGQCGSLKSRISIPLTLVLQARLALRLADAVVVLSTEDFDHLVAKGRTAASTFLVPNGVGAEFLETPLANPPPPFRVVFVGSWLDRKGVHELLEAWRELHALRGLELMLLGTATALEDELRKLTRDERAAIHVEPEVAPPRLLEFLAAGHAFVLAGWFEGMPLSALEAMAAGVPVVLGDVCGNRDLLSPGNPEACGGLLVKPNDAAELRDVLAMLCDDEPLRRSLAVAARERARQFTWTRTAGGLEAAYRHAAAASSRPRRPATAGSRRRRSELPAADTELA